MASFRLKRFCNAAVLKNIDFRLLHRFLHAHKDYLADCGFRWSDDPRAFDYDEL